MITLSKQGVYILLFLVLILSVLFCTAAAPRKAAHCRGWSYLRAHGVCDLCQWRSLNVLVGFGRSTVVMRSSGCGLLLFKSRLLGVLTPSSCVQCLVTLKRITPHGRGRNVL